MKIDRYIKFWNGKQMPIIGLGTWQASDEEISVAVDAALEAGYRHIDTAYVYENEAAIGKALKKWFDSGRIKREELFIVTKLPMTGFQPEKVEKYLNKSLAALQLSYVDLYLIHFPCGLVDKEGNLFPVDEAGNLLIDPTTDHVALWKAMEAQVDAGKAHSIGLSNFNARQIERVVKAARIPPANLQVELHVYFQQRELVDFCKALDITVCAYAPIGSPGLSQFMDKIGGDKSSLPSLSPLSDPVVKEIAQKHKKTTAQILLQHIMLRGIAVIPKSANPERIKQNIEVFDFTLDEEDVKRLDSLDKGNKARLFSGDMLKGISKHPEYPYKDAY
ncbi:1,5-anhydro-D-fructose reductase-like [Bacillus rossius redtenbacheri]|uniref:1,5-anhydro-D-fructose reductase-like n=1 Tax=Bacillus rossius redtenbacheri TaxID=93214 RepID=UPI002FDE55B2